MNIDYKEKYIKYKKKYLSMKNQIEQFGSAPRQSTKEIVLESKQNPDTIEKEEYVFNNETLRIAVRLWFDNKEEAIRQYGDINTWNVSKVTDMEELFFKKDKFNDDISNWNVSNVTNMKRMFYDADVFNQPLGQWNVGNVTTMKGMFNSASAFNQPLANWERRDSTVGNVTNMRSMFYGASAFNQPLEQWNVANVTDMQSMFRYASAFNQPLEQWNVGNVTTMWGMLANSLAFNQPLANWERVDSTVRNVTDMEDMFHDASTFNQPLEQWNVSNVTNMRSMFSKASAFNQPLEQWNVGKVTTMMFMFFDAVSFNQPLANWERVDSTVGNVTDMTGMFQRAVVFDQPLGQWNVGNKTIVQFMFQDANAFLRRYPNALENPRSVFTSSESTSFANDKEKLSEYELGELFNKFQKNNKLTMPRLARLLTVKRDNDLYNLSLKLRLSIGFPENLFLNDLTTGSQYGDLFAIIFTQNEDSNNELSFNGFVNFVECGVNRNFVDPVASNVKC